MIMIIDLHADGHRSNGDHSLHNLHISSQFTFGIPSVSIQPLSVIQQLSKLDLFIFNRYHGSGVGCTLF